MILVDTSVWIGHLRGRESALAAELNAGRALMHPVRAGRAGVRHAAQPAGASRSVPRPTLLTVATDDEAMLYLEQHGLMGRGIGWVDVHLLAAAALAGTARLWTRDGRLAAVAADLSLSHRTC